MEKLRNLTPRQLKELQQVAKKKGVWLEHRSNGKLVDATRTYWLVDDQELATFLPEEPEDEPISVADPQMGERCPNAHRGCIFVGTSVNSLNTHARFCNFNKEKAKPAAAAKAGKADKADIRQTRQARQPRPMRQ